MPIAYAHPQAYVVLPWRASRATGLPDHLRLTYLLIVSLAYERDRRRTPPVSRRELAAWRELAVRTIDDHLAALRQRGLIRNDPMHIGPGLVIELLSPDALDTQDAATIEPPTLRASADITQDQAPESDAASAPQPTLRRSASLEEEGSLYSLDEETLLLSRTLIEAGVYPGVAQRIANQPWVTLDLAQRWISAFERSPAVRKLGAVLATTLNDPKKCFPPPPSPVAQPLPDPSPGAQPDVVERAPDPVDEPDLEPEPPTFDWDAFVERMRPVMGDHGVETWLSEASVLSCGEDGVVLALGSALAVKYVQQRFLPEMQAALGELLGRKVRVGLTVARLDPTQGM